MTFDSFRISRSQQGLLRLPQAELLPLIARHMRPDPAFFGELKGIPWPFDVDEDKIHPFIARYGWFEVCDLRAQGLWLR